MDHLDLPLDQHLEGVDRALATWTEAEKRRIEDAQRACVSEVAKDEQELRQLQERQTSLQASAKTAEANREQQKRSIHGREHELRGLQAQVLKVEPVLAGLKSREALHLGNVAKVNEESARMTQAHQTVVDELMKGIHMYQKLGLVIDRKGENNLGFVFTQIDPQNPEREFSFALRMHERQDVFAVEHCIPDVADAPMLLDQLNQTGNMSAFVRAMRQRYKSLV
ncbi:hypothetical protein SPRG_04164 [Saprolegnia parasitica CBS 223.65]|uniref:Kinetochore protein SPC25 n=1 Tax=Saprolegnia parasitica (strain CBS 223.65) TaxID=695850 RepID=A0A067CWQ3_SAPPC|nr:hypothetical protein SPRG_04164 [Saprolegnia parasitica CBS 223.65]KDO30976.1 hypothetical protein SPRG_04164 [Saprolegnia parasitica CBS 223.65]|eukprot:XP_012198160.1 hypothetical protein SPRG_04164 [Saprolegnia parasitica CBS 223.65]